MSTERWEIDSSRSGIHFAVRHLVLSKTRGRFSRWSGTAVVPDGDFTRATVDVVIDDEFNEVAMISPNQEMIIFPFSFTAACIEKQCICTILLAFNMLLENDGIGEISPATYENIMLNIHHIVPPYTLEPDG